MSNKPPDDKDDLLELIKKLWLPVTGFLGAVILAYNFYQLWLGDQKTITWFLVGGGVAITVISLIWVGFGKIRIQPTWSRGSFFGRTEYRFSLSYRRAAWGGLGVFILLAIIGVLALVQGQQARKKYQAEQERKMIVVIAAFEGPEEVYGLRNEIIENLNADFMSDEDVEVIIVDDVITLTEGSDYARKLGERYLADIVIWGWYRPTENPNITVHIEDLTLKQFYPLRESATLKPTATLAEMESFDFQQRAGQETSALIAFLAGYLELQARNYDAAILRFDQALENVQDKAPIIENQSEIYYYKGVAHIAIYKFDLAILDYDKAIEINPQNVNAYNNRGIVYAILGQHEHAIQDYSKAIEISPQDANAYNSRGSTYNILSEYELAIQDYDKAIEIDPDLELAYIGRGNAFSDLGQYENAIQSYDMAIRKDSQSAEAYLQRALAYNSLKQYELSLKGLDKAIALGIHDASTYNNRGAVHSNLGQYELAIQDFEKAIQLEPKSAAIYGNRGYAYANLGKFDRAIQDFDEAIQLDPNSAYAYFWRGTIYKNLSKIAEAEADFKKYEELTGQKP